MIRGLALAVALPLLLGTLAACSKAQARTPAEIVVLEMPPPPARVAVPVTLEVPEETPEPEPPPPPPAPSRPRDSAPRASSQPAPASQSSPEPESAPVLQTTPNVESIAQQTLALIARAERDLNQVNYRDLNNQAKAQYDSAMGFVRQAKQALQIKNYMFAQQLATKAALVASALVRG